MRRRETGHGGSRPARAAVRLFVPGATMAAGFVLGVFLIQPRAALPVAAQDGRFTAQAALAEALSTQLAAEHDAASQPVRIGVTFRDAGGAICRSFLDARNETPFAGIACRDGVSWRIAMLTPAAGDAAVDAGAVIPPLVNETVGALMRGAPLDAAQEHASRERGWR